MFSAWRYRRVWRAAHGHKRDIDYCARQLADAHDYGQTDMAKTYRNMQRHYGLDFAQRIKWRFVKRLSQTMGARHGNAIERMLYHAGAKSYVDYAHSVKPSVEPQPKN